MIDDDERSLLFAWGRLLPGGRDSSLQLSSAQLACVRAYVRVCVAAAAHMAFRSLFIVCWIVSACSPRRGDGANEPPPLTAAEIRAWLWLQLPPPPSPLSKV